MAARWSAGRLRNTVQEQITAIGCAREAWAKLASEGVVAATRVSNQFIALTHLGGADIGDPWKILRSF